MINMNDERKLTFIYFVLGLVVGVLSVNLNVGLSIVIAALVYGTSLLVVKQFVKEKKKLSWYLLNTLITFVLVWLVVWILLFNLR